MPRPHHRALAVAGLGLASLASAAPAQADPAAEPTVVELARRSLEGNAALMRGDIELYRRLVPLAADFTLMSPFGGTPSRGAAYTEETWASIGRFFRNGTLRQELVQAYASADLVVLAVVERSHVEVGGLPAQDWALRVTLVYRREGSEWRLAHRHADPLANGIAVAEAAGLARARPAPKTE